MTVLEQLLRVQEHDTAIDRLRHRRRNLPERTVLAQLDDRRGSLTAARAEVVFRRDEVATRQERFERDLETTEARIRVIDRRMYSGEVSASRELQAMAGEIESLRARASSLEDGALEAIDEREPLDAEVARFDAELAALEGQASEVQAALAAAEAAIDQEIERETQARDDATAGVPPELLVEYERLRKRHGGVGVARLEHGMCAGCHLQLPATEVDRLRHVAPDAIVHCEQCGRLLVR